jgi:hypothetical protein
MKIAIILTRHLENPGGFSEANALLQRHRY